MQSQQPLRLRLAGGPPDGSVSNPSQAETHSTATATESKANSRRTRIVTAALDLAANGRGAVRIRCVADLAGVSPSTVYRHFSSKDDLLVSCLHQWLGQASCGFLKASETLDTADRVLDVVEVVTHELCAQPLLAEAVIRAYLYPDAGATETAELCRKEISQIFTAAIDNVSDEGAHVGELVTDVWAMSIPAIVQNRETVAGFLARMGTALAAIGLDSPAQMVC